MRMKTAEQLNEELFERMSAEQEEFKKKILSMPPNEILQNAYELIIREDILLAVEENELSAQQARILLKSKTPLCDVYKSWENHEGHHMEEIIDVIEEHADEKIRDAKERAERERGR